MLHGSARSGLRVEVKCTGCRIDHRRAGNAFGADIAARQTTGDGSGQLPLPEHRARAGIQGVNDIILGRHDQFGRGGPFRLPIQRLRIDIAVNRSAKGRIRLHPLGGVKRQAWHHIQAMAIIAAVIGPNLPCACRAGTSQQAKRCQSRTAQTTPHGRRCDK